MKGFIISLVMLLASQSISAQKVNYQIHLDTLNSFDNRILARYRIFMGDKILEESCAYLYPITHRIPRFRLTGNLIQKEIEMDSIVRHGATKKYLENRLIKKVEFVNGKEINAIYYDQNGREICKKEFLNTYNLRKPEIIGEYIITGLKNKK